MDKPAGRFQLSSFLDDFIPVDLQANAETHRRARMFMLSHVFGPMLGLSIPIYMYLLDISRDVHVVVFFALVLSFWAYPFLLRATGRYQLLAFASVQNLIFCVLWACFAYGGMVSPFLPWILILPLLAFLYLPPQGWVRNGLLLQIFGSVAGFIAYCTLGGPLPPTDLDGLQVIGLVSMASVAIYFAMMSLYFAKMYREQGQFMRELNSLVSTSDNLRNLTTAANQASRAKADFVAGMSHELRTPLNAIIGYSQLLLEEAEDEGDGETVTDIGHVRDAGTHLLALIDDILALSRVEAGKMPLNPTGDTIARQAATWLDGPRMAAIRDHVSLRPDIAHEMLPIQIDWTIVRTVVQHALLGVASQSPGGMTEVAARQRDETLCIVISHKDATGRLRAIEVNSELFETDGDASASKYGATGIEFPLVQKLAELLGGDVAARVDANGPALAVTLPLQAQFHRLAA